MMNMMKKVTVITDPITYPMIANWTDLLNNPTFLLLMCTILGVSYSKNIDKAERAADFATCDADILYKIVNNHKYRDRPVTWHMTTIFRTSQLG